MIYIRDEMRHRRWGGELLICCGRSSRDCVRVSHSRITHCRQTHPLQRSSAYVTHIVQLSPDTELEQQQQRNHTQNPITNSHFEHAPERTTRTGLLTTWRTQEEGVALFEHDLYLCRTVCRCIKCFWCLAASTLKRAQWSS